MVLLAAVVALTLARALIAGATGLVDDEAYYRLWALKPALSYLDHPPMVAYFIAAGRALFGDNPFGIRFGAGAAALITLAAVWRIAVLLFSRELAQKTLWLMLAMPLLAVGGVIITPDIPSVMFYALTLWSLAELSSSNNANWWLATGTFCGLGLLSKYTNLFAGATILIWLLWVPQNRRWFSLWQLWAGGLIAALLTLPVIIWNAGHDWASFGKQFGRVGAGNSLTLKYLAELFGGLAGLANPVIFILASLGIVALWRRAWHGKDNAATLIIASMVPMTAYFLVHALHDRVQGNWLGPIYPALAISAAFGLQSITSELTRARVFTTATATGLIMIAIVYVHALAPFAGFLLRADPTSQMRGWAEFARDIEALRKETGARWIATSSFATTGQLAYALRDAGVPVVQINERLRYAHLPEPDAELLKSPALYVELERRERPELLAALFDTRTALGPRARGPATAPYATYVTYLAVNPAGVPLTP